MKGGGRKESFHAVNISTHNTPYSRPEHTQEHRLYRTLNTLYRLLQGEAWRVLDQNAELVVMHRRAVCWWDRTGLLIDGSHAPDYWLVRFILRGSVWSMQARKKEMKGEKKRMNWTVGFNSLAKKLVQLVKWGLVGSRVQLRRKPCGGTRQEKEKASK